MYKDNKFPKLGIIAGDGSLPIAIANSYNELGGHCVIACLEKKLLENVGLSNNITVEDFRIGQVGKIISFLKKYEIENIIIIGAIKRPDLTSIKVDMSGAMLLARITKQKILGDDNVLKVIANYIEEKGFKVISPMDILDLVKYRDYNVSALNQANKDDIRDIDLGINVINSLSYLDIGQSVIVEDGYVLGIEAAEGTDNLINRCAILRKKKKGAILIKMPKKTQDMRLDIPAIGPETIRNLVKNNYSGIAIKKDHVLIIDFQEVRDLCLENNLFIHFIN